jgi:hypothetical protein
VLVLASRPLWPWLVPRVLVLASRPPPPLGPLEGSLALVPRVLVLVSPLPPGPLEGSLEFTPPLIGVALE